MDEIEHKLESNNPILISHTISKIVDIIKKKSEETADGDVSKIPELTFLLSKCESTNHIVSVTAYQALVILVQSGILGIGTTLSNLMASLGTTKNYAAVTTAISTLLLLDLEIHVDKAEYVCPFTLRAPQHPLITVLNQKKDTWKDVLSQMESLMNHRRKELVLYSVELLRPVFLYILCNPKSSLSESCKQYTWHLLIKMNNISSLHVELLQWLRMNNVTVCIDTNHRVLELAEMCLLNKDRKFCTALMPLIVSLVIKLLEYGCDPRSNFDMLSKMADYCDNSCSVTIALFTEVILICPAIYLFDVVQLCSALLEKLLCNGAIAYALIASLLQWMAYPSLLSSNALEIAKDVINTIANKKTWPPDKNTFHTNNIFVAIRHANSNLQFYSELCRYAETWTDNNILLWLKTISNAPKDIKYRCKLILSGLFLQSKNLDVTAGTCDILIQIAKENNNFASHLLSMLLYKLTNLRNYNESKVLLFAISELAMVKENVPIVIYTLETLFVSAAPLKQLAIELYLRTYKNEPRCYRYLQTALVEASKKDHTWETDITCARAMRYICETNPEHGTELVPLLSQILNRCNKLNGSTASALAIKSISALCKSGVIDICSTWKVLAPRMNKDNRVIVLKSLCELFGDIPSYPNHPGDAFDKVITEIITKLWSYVSSSKEIEIIESALKALATYQVERIPLKSLPVKFRENLELPSAYAKTPIDAARKPEDVLPYIPCVCWIQMLEKINETALVYAGNLLISFITVEISDLPSHIYTWPQGEPHTFNYLLEKSVVRAIGEYLRRSKTSPDLNKERIIIECLRIFAQKYPKPLPPVNYNFLERTSKISNEAKKYSIAIACRQAIISPTAKQFIENYLVTLVDCPTIQFNDYLSLHSHLEELCRAVPPNILRPFLEVTLTYILEKESVDTNDRLQMFTELMHCYKRALEDETIHDANRTLLSIVLEEVLDRIEVNCKLFEPYTAAVVELSVKYIDRMTSPSVWWEITPEKMKKATAIRAKLASKKDVCMPLNWMNEIIDTVVTMPRLHIFVLNHMKTIMSTMQLEKHTANWTLHLIGQIQAILVDKSHKDDANIAFLCDVFLIAIISLSGMDCLQPCEELLVMSCDTRVNLFPQAIACLAQRESWTNIIPQIMEWLNHMRASSVVPKLYKNIFYNALVSLKHEHCFSDVWTKYLSIKPMINV